MDDETAREGAGSRKIHKPEDLPKTFTDLGEMANPQADFFSLGIFLFIGRIAVMVHVFSIQIKPENCRGCRRCQVACSWHDPGPLNPRLAGIDILSLDEGGTDYPVINMECLERFCGKHNPHRSHALEPACVSACLFGALEMTTGENGHE
jgi:ferredoxin